MNISRFLSVSALLLAVSGGAFASTLESYDERAFQEARSSGGTVVLQFHKEGCATCAAQQAALDTVIRDESPEKLRVFSVKFDPASEIAKRYGVRSQSTMVVLLDDHMETVEQFLLTALPETWVRLITSI